MNDAARTLIFIPTYNERENAPRMAEELLGLPIDADILFVDDHSQDGTGELLEAIAAREPRVTVLHRPGKLGIGSAHLAGIRHAYANGYRWLVTLDCDFTHSPSDIPRLYAVRETADVIVGSRHLRADSLPGWTAYRRFMTKLGHFMTRSVLRLPFDASGAFRVYDLARIPERLFSRVQALSYHFFFESLFILQHNGMSIREVAIVLPARTYGHSKMTLRDVVRSATRILMLGLQARLAPGRFTAADDAPAPERGGDAATEWDRYWGGKATPSGVTYDCLATIYRNLVIKPALRRALQRTFAPGSSLLHAGCGSGQVDVGLHQRLRITAMDISPKAVSLYRRHNPNAEAVLTADLFDLPFGPATFDGIYNLGVMEHFSPDDIVRILRGFHRILRPGGTLLLFWPHARATSAWVLDAWHAASRPFSRPGFSLHPPEPSRVKSRHAIEPLFRAAGFRVDGYRFGPGDFWVQVVVTASRIEDAAHVA